MNSSGWVYIFMELKERELDSRLLLACFAAERGHNVLIAPHNLLKRRAQALPKGVFYDRSIFPIRKEELNRYKKYGHALVVSDEESQGIYTDAKFRYFDSRLSNETLDLCKRYFTWGEEQNNLLSEAFPDNADKFVTTGSARFDAWRAPFNDLYADKVKDIQDRYGRYILLPSNFGLLMNNLEKQQLLDQARRIGTLDTEKGQRFWNGVFDHQEKVIKQYREAIIAITKRFPSHKVIIRPHPVENIGKWHDFMAGVEGCEIVFEGPAAPWLKGADVILHNGCTTSLEAYFMGKNTIAYSPLYDEEFDETLLKKTSLMVSNLDDLLNGIETCLNGELNTREYVGEELKHYFHWQEERYACEEIVDHLTQIISENETFSRPQTVGRFPGGVMGEIRARLHQRRNPQGLKNWPGGVIDHEFQDRVKFFCQSSERLSDLEATRLTFDGVFWIRKRASK